jgi:WW domain
MATSVPTQSPNSPPKKPLTVIVGQTPSGLPAEWEVRFSKSRQLPYYYNAETTESRWEPPSNTDLPALEAHLKSIVEQHKLQATETTGKIRVRHLLIKHSQSRRPSSWKEVPPPPHSHCGPRFGGVLRACEADAWGSTRSREVPKKQGRSSKRINPALRLGKSRSLNSLLRRVIARVPVNTATWATLDAGRCNLRSRRRRLNYRSGR